MSKAAFTSTASAHSMRIIWRVEAKDTPMSKWRMMSIHNSHGDALTAARALDQDGLEPDGKTLRVRMVAL